MNESAQAGTGRATYRLNHLTRRLTMYEGEARVRAFINEVWNHGKLASLNSHLAPMAAADCDKHAFKSYGVPSYRQLVSEVRRAFPNLHVEIQSLKQTVRGVT